MKISVARFPIFLAVLISSIFIFASPAFAHAQLDSTNPAASSTLSKSPKTIELTFSENVELTFGSVRLYDGRGDRISTSSPKKQSGQTVAIKPPRLQNGTYVVAWNVVSADSHAVRGAFTFSVGDSKSNQTSSSNTLSQVLSEPGTSSVIKFGFTFVRFLAFLSLALIIGIVAMRLFIAKRWEYPRVDQILFISLITLFFSSLLSIGFQAALAGRFSLTQAFSFDVLNQERATRFGRVELLRAFTCILMYLSWTFTKEKLFKIMALLSAFVLAMTPAMSGHGSTGQYVAFAFGADVIHVLASSIWFGGLLVLPFLILQKDGQEVTKRFSQVALSCVVAIAATGVFAWWRQVGSYEASVSTWFGQLINLKVVLFLSAIVVAWFSRSHVQSMLTKSDKNTRLRLTKLVYLESALLIVVMVATSVVVNFVPGRTALALPSTKQLSSPSSRMDITFDPAKTGPTNIHVYVLQKNGLPYTFDQSMNTLGSPAVTAFLFNEKRDVGPLPIVIRFAGGNHFISAGANFPFSGTWKVTLKLKIDEFNQEVFNAEIKVR